MCDPQNEERRKHNMNSLGVVIASQRAASDARSALPAAPVIEKHDEPQPARPKRAAATLLRRFAARLDPSY
jgi:hypothetical protein